MLIKRTKCIEAILGWGSSLVFHLTVFGMMVGAHPAWTRKGSANSGSAGSVAAVDTKMRESESKTLELVPFDDKPPAKADAAATAPTSQLSNRAGFQVAPSVRPPQFLDQKNPVQTPKVPPEIQPGDIEPTRPQDQSLRRAMLATMESRMAPTALTAEPSRISPRPSSSAKSSSAPAQITSPVQFLENPSPVYPAGAYRAGLEGKVVLKVFVESDGHPGRIEILKSSGSRELDAAAFAAVKKWKFRPARSFGVAVASMVKVPIRFSLERNP